MKRQAPPIDDACIPTPTADGRFATELRFRLDPSAPSDRVGALQRILRLPPTTTTIMFALDPVRGVRALRITGSDVGDVFTFATRIADAIREIGDLVREETAQPAPAATEPAATETPVAVVAADDVPGARWTYEPPGTFLEADEASAPPPRANVARAFARGARRVVSRFFS